MTKFIVVEDGGIWAEVRAYVNTKEEAEVYICQNKMKNKHKWYIYERV